MLAGALQIGVSVAGSLEVNAYPSVSTATQSAFEGQETAVGPFPSMLGEAFQVGVSAVGSVVISTWPA